MLSLFLCLPLTIVMVVTRPDLQAVCCLGVFSSQRSTLPTTAEPIDVSSEFASINRRAHEQSIQERAAATQGWVAASEADLKPSDQHATDPRSTATQHIPEKTEPFLFPFLFLLLSFLPLLIFQFQLLFLLLLYVITR